MPEDALLKDLRRLRRQVEAENENDPGKYYEHLLHVQQQYGNKLVRRKPAEALKRRNAV